MPGFKAQEDMQLQVAGKVVGRLRGEEFPHFGVAWSGGSAWVRRLHAPRAAIVIEVMLHETNPLRSGSDRCLWSRTARNLCRTDCDLSLQSCRRRSSDVFTLFDGCWCLGGEVSRTFREGKSCDDRFYSLTYRSTLLDKAINRSEDSMCLRQGSVPNR